uniref:site-specific DNA-methyltransferase (adenine-specific) n=1 Tax=viral metagenome TaxID=1070528 RepID=A0A6C0APE1_9ZZZZ
MSGTGITMHPSVKNLESVVKRVRDVLRKGDGITDMDSMAHCVLFTAARMLDTATATKLNVPYTWDSVISKVLAKDINGADKAFKDILEVLDSKFSTNEFTWKLKVQDDFEKIVKLFNELDIHEVAKHTDVLGFIYEQHISTGSGGGRDLGKFYTDRQITRYLTELLGSDITADRPDSMCDATMGTGGFILSYIEYVTKMCRDVKWDDYDLAGGDIDDKVAAIARLNVFLRTGKLFPMIRKRNTLKNDIGDSSDKRKTFKRLLMNIPFGVKGLTLADDCCERIKEIVKVGTKSEPLFMTLTCQLLAEGGKAAVIVPDGVLVNCSNQHDAFRQYLLDNFKVLRIIKMRGKFFMNTGIQPSVIVFERSGKTDTIEFWDVEKKDSGDLVETLMLTVAREKFIDSCSFDLRRYQKATILANPGGYPTVKLGDILSVSKGSEVITLEKATPGDIPLYSASVDVRTHNRPGFNGDESIIQACVGSNLVNCIHFVNKPFAATGNLWVLRKKEGHEFSLKFIYYWLLITKAILKKVNISVLPKVNRTEFDSIEIQLPPLLIQQEIVDALDLIYNNAATAKAAAVSIKAQMAAVMRSVGARGYEKKKLGDLVGIEGGDYITKKDETLGEYPVYGGGTASYHINRFNREPTCVINKDGMSLSCVQMVNTRFFLNHHGWTLKLKTDEALEKFLHWQLYFRASDIYTLATGSCQKGLNQKEFVQMTLYIPPLSIQQEILAILNEMESELKAMEQMAARAEQRAKYILDGYLCSNVDLTPVLTANPNNQQDASVNTLIPVNEIIVTTEAPKAKRILKIKK